MARFVLEEYKAEGDNHTQVKVLEQGDDDASLQLKMVDFSGKGWKVRLYDHAEKAFLYPETVLARYEASMKDIDKPAPTVLELLLGRK